MSCWSRDRAQLVERVAPGLCSTDPTRPAGEVFPVEFASDRQCLTTRVECDAETAAIRALGQYLAMLERPHLGRLMEFRTVTEGWPDTMEIGVMPAVGVTRIGTTSYDRDMAPQTDKIPGAPDGMVFVKNADWNGSLRLLVLATDREERVGLRMMIEDALFPHDFCGGLRLVVPFYAGLHIEYVPVSGGFDDGPDTTAQRLFGMTFDVQVSVPMFRIARLPMARVVSRGHVVSSQDPDSEDRALIPLSIS